MSMPSLLSRSVSFKTQYLFGWEKEMQVRRTLLHDFSSKNGGVVGGSEQPLESREKRKKKDRKKQARQKGDRLPQVLVCCDCPHMKSSSSVSSPFSPRASRAASSARLIMSCRSSSVRLLGGLFSRENFLHGQHVSALIIVFSARGCLRGAERILEGGRSREGKVSITSELAPSPALGGMSACCSAGCPAGARRWRRSGPGRPGREGCWLAPVRRARGYWRR